MPMVDTGDVRLHVQRMGPRDGHPAVGTVLLVHGLLTDSLASYYFTVAPAFAAAGLDVVMYDLRGHGRSGRPPTGYTLDDAVDDLAALLDRLAVTGPVHLVGNSYGGTVAFGYAARHPERAASVSLIESEPATAAWAAKLDGILRRVQRELAYNETDALAWITVNRGHNTARLARGAARLARETTLVRDIPASSVLTEDGMRAVGCPVLGLYGGDSDLAALVPWLEASLPDCRTVVVPGHEHSVLVEAAGTVGGHVLALIEGSGGRGPGRVSIPGGGGGRASGAAGPAVR
ncbi:alpha/beta fold hydrolase [Streptomyces sp. NPDC090075]|uniref:alpha/beta fold hydrolase n=1 Tax=Streptomyces sp. NPDC090075 TaxID=3365937 RepID=UPI0038272D83